MHERMARKRHVCSDAAWRVRNDMPTKCSGEIGIGETYCEVPEWQDDVFHPPRYHRSCYDRAVKDEAKRIIEFAAKLKTGVIG